MLRSGETNPPRKHHISILSILSYLATNKASGYPILYYTDKAYLHPKSNHIIHCIPQGCDKTTTPSILRPRHINIRPMRRPCDIPSQRHALHHAL